MTHVENYARLQFDDLKLGYVHALYVTYEREIEARDAGNLDLARRLYENRERFLSLFLELRRTEKMFTRSKLSVVERLNVLSGVSRSLREFTEMLETPGSAQRGSDQIHQLLTNLSERLR